MLISFNNDFIISLGDDGNIIRFNYQLNKESKINFRDEILGKEILLKEQVRNNHSFRLVLLRGGKS